MSYLNFALAHSELGISHFTKDLILVLSFAVVTALPMSLLRPQIKEENVKWSLIKIILSLISQIDKNKRKKGNI